MNSRLLFTLFLGVLLAALDIAVLGPALPAIRLEFGAGSRDASWLITAYVLANLFGTPLLGRLSDRIGRRPIYLLSIGIFGFGSLGVVLAPDLAWITIFRAFQGFGSGGIFPVATAVIGEVAPVEQRGRTLGLLGATFGLAFLIGPPLGGMVLAFADWRWIFGINLPLGLLVMGLAWKQIPASTPGSTSGSFDWPGLVSFGGGLVMAALGLSNLDPSSPLFGFEQVRVWLPLAAGAVLLGITPWVEHRARDPILPPSLIGPGILRNVLWLGLGAGIGEVGVMVLPDLAVQTLGVSPAKASLYLVPLVLGLTLAAPITGRLLDRIGARPIVATGVALQAISFGAFHWIPTSPALYFVVGPLFGAALACLLASPLRWLLLRHAPVDQRTASQALLSLSHSVGQIATAAILGALASGSGLRFALGIAGIASLFLFVPALAIPSSHTRRTSPQTKG
ncbi:MAG TPA: MFS transporter [Fibrobacteria bacterium]|nr:MFS transporter [Fibrobacteria bacterium]